MNKLNAEQVDEIKRNLRLIGVSRPDLANELGQSLSTVNMVLARQRGCTVHFARTIHRLTEGVVSASYLLGI
jgi:antitoxin component HigA of HigAB toxin-antitoxin module